MPQNKRFAVRRKGSRQVFLADKQGNITGATKVGQQFDTSGAGGIDAPDNVASKALNIVKNAGGRVSGPSGVDITKDENVLTVGQNATLSHGDQIEKSDQFQTSSGETAVGKTDFANRTGFGRSVKVGGAARFDNRARLQGDLTTSGEAQASNTAKITGDVTTNDQSAFDNRSQGTVKGTVRANDQSSVRNAGTVEESVSASENATFENARGGVVRQNVSLLDSARGNFRSGSRVGRNVTSQDNALAKFERDAVVGGEIRADSRDNIDLPQSQPGTGGGRFAEGAGPAGGIRLTDSNGNADRAPEKRRFGPRTTPVNNSLLGSGKSGGTRRRRLLG